VLHGQVRVQARGSWGDTVIYLDGTPRALTGVDGWIAVFEVEPGLRTLEARKNGYLYSRRTIEVIPGVVTWAGETLLIAGDTFPDNRIDVLDAITVQAAWGRCAGMPGYQRWIDSDGSGCVGADDLRVVHENMGLVGPLPWSAVPIVQDRSR
jgi:hypothetical protein